MAFVIKNQRNIDNTPNSAVLEQRVHVSRPASTAAALVASATNIFQVVGGRVLVKGLLGQVTTIIQAQTTNIKTSSTAKDNAGTTIGTAVDVSANVDCTGLEVGGLVWTEGDGTAAVKSNAGAAFIGSNSGQWIAPQGYISYTAGATSTGGFKWDLWYLPLDPGAYVTAVPLTGAGV